MDRPVNRQIDDDWSPNLQNHHEDYLCDQGLLVHGITPFLIISIWAKLETVENLQKSSPHSGANSHNKYSADNICSAVLTGIGLYSRVLHFRGLTLQTVVLGRFGVESERTLAR